MKILYPVFKNRISKTMSIMLNVLSKKYKLTLLFFDSHYLIQDYLQNNENVSIETVKNRNIKNPFLNYIYKLFQFIIFTNKSNYDLYIIFTYLFSFLIKLLCYKKKFLYIHGHVTVGNKFVRNFFHNLHKRINAIVFTNQLIVNYSIIKYFNPSKKKYELIPAFLEKKSNTEKIFDKINLLYVGSLNLRNIHLTILGLKKFVELYANKIQIKYYIIGSGSTETVNNLKEAIAGNKLESYVEYLGYLDDDKIKYYYDKCNIGVAFIPVTKYYLYNTSNKLYEYLLSGMCTIATALEANKEIINDDNGIIIEDTENGFFNGLVHIFNNINIYNSIKIRNTVDNHNVISVTNNHIIPYIDRILKND